MPWYSTYWYMIALLIFSIGVTAITISLDSASYSVDATSLSISEVKQGDFTVSVRGTGTLVPRDIRYIAANVSGRVEVIYAKPGARLKPGDLILQLSNPVLIQQAEEIAWELEALAAENNAQKVTLESQLLDGEALRLNAKMRYESARINLDAERKLIEEGNGTVSLIEHQRSLLETEQFQVRSDIEEKRLAKLKETMVARIAASEARYNSLKKTHDRALQQIEDLDIRATLDGVLQTLPVEPGQQVSIGDNLARLASQRNLIAELQIPERQVNGVEMGHPVIIDTRRSEVAGEVIRIDPAVVNGVVQVDVALTEDLPREARPDLTVDGTIHVAQIPDTLYVGRPTYAQNHAISSVYLLTDDGQFAERATVSYGISSAGEIQVLEGLRPGQKIILSDSTAWADLERISIQ